MEPNDKMLIQDIEDIGKSSMIIDNHIKSKEDLIKDELIDVDMANDDEDDEIDEDINMPRDIKGKEEDNNNKEDEMINVIKEDNNNNNNMIIDSEPNLKAQSHRKEKNNLMRFPLAKIKNTIKLDDDIKLCQKNVYYVIGKMTELFLQELARNAHQICKMSKRKTLNIDDICTAIKGKDKYFFIDMPSIFHIDILGSHNVKEKKSKSMINQLTILPEPHLDPNSDALLTTSTSNAKNKQKEKKETKPKSEKAKTAQKKKEANSNMKIDQMFPK